MTSEYRTCACGASFKRSRTDATVRCPDCRSGRRTAAKSSACVVCEGERYITDRRADGTVERVPCYRCNR